MWFREQGHVFDWGTMKWCEAYASPPNGCYDAENVALDEFGHVEGLGHHDNYDSDSDYGDAVVQTYSRTKPSAGYNKHVFGRCDVARLQIMYDTLTTAAKFSTCLDMSTVLTIAASPTQIVVGNATTLVATLKVVDADFVRAPRRQPGLGPDRHAAAPGGRHDDVDRGRDDAGRLGLRHVRARPAAGRRHRVPGGLRDALERGHQR